MRSLMGLAVLAVVAGTVTAPVAAQGAVGIDVAPIVVQVCCPADGSDAVITGRTWSTGDQIELYVNGSYVATSIAEPTGEGDASPYFSIRDDDGSVYPGSEVTFVRTGDGRTETHIVTSLVMSNIDITSDVVEGGAEPGTEVVILVPEASAVRVETVDGAGMWWADFSTPGDEPSEGDVADILYWTEVAAAQFDADGNATSWQAGSGEYAPVLVALDGADRLYADSDFQSGPQVVSGQSWPIGAEVDLFINGSYVATSIAEQNGEGSATPFFDLAALGTSVMPSDEVTLALADGSRTESHVVRDIAVTTIDAAADTVAGTAVPESEVFVATVAWVEGNPVAFRAVTADDAGAWLADFSQLGGGPLDRAIIDLVPSTIGLVAQPDDSGNATFVIWMPAPTTKEQCKNGGWQHFGFKNQGLCVSSLTADR